MLFSNEIFKFPERVDYFWFFQEKIGRSKDILLCKINMYSILLQKLLRIKRHGNIEFQKGANWFSITDELAKYVISKETWIKKVFRFSYCCDEIFLQTIVYHSKYKNRLYCRAYGNAKAIMRYTDWKRGRPYVFRNTDIDELLASDMLFARKFDCEIDREIIETLKQRICGLDC